MKRSMRATASRTVRRAATWRPKRLGNTALDIRELISPLRYDVQVRADFFSFLARRPPGESDEQLVEASLAEPYRLWFRHVAMARFRPWTLAVDRVFEQEFAERVLTARELWRSFTSSGFDRHYPVTLRAGRGPTLTDSGVVVDRPLHVGDGGHRLALLLTAGGWLAEGQYRIDTRFAPVIDNTALLAPLLGLSEGDYTRFLAAGYGLSGCTNLQDFCSLIESETPDREHEVRALMKAHGFANTVVP